MTRYDEYGDGLFYGVDNHGKMAVYDRNGNLVQYNAAGYPIRDDGRVTYTPKNDPVPRTSSGFPVASAVVAQENRGAQEVVASEEIPKDHPADDVKKLGIVILGPSDENPLFVKAQLPSGWKKVRNTQDYRTIDVLDENGNRRAYMWYKAASYDSFAYMIIRRRFEVQHRFNKDYTICTAYVVDVKDSTNPVVVFKGKRVKGASVREMEETEKQARQIARDWLAKHLPDAGDVNAYWNDNPLPKVCDFPSWH